jgi:hypothetical protein
MRIRHNWRTSLSSIGVLAILAGCASTPENTVELERARDTVAKVAGTSESSVVASAELKQAQETLRRAEEPSRRPRRPMRSATRRCWRPVNDRPLWRNSARIAPRP